MLKDKSLLEDSNLVEELDNKVSQALSGGKLAEGTSYFNDGSIAYKIDCDSSDD